MKKIILSALMLFSIHANAQVKTLFQDAPYESRFLFRDSVKLTLSKAFNYYIDSLKTGDELIYAFEDSLKHNINIRIYKSMKGENKDLRIEGKPVISGASITGPYLELFDIWKKYFDPEADLVKIQKEGKARLGKVRFGTYTKNWIIHTYYFY